MKRQLAPRQPGPNPKTRNHNLAQPVAFRKASCLLTEGNKRCGKLSVDAYVLPGIPPLPIAAPVRASGPDIFISTASNETSTWIPAPGTTRTHQPIISSAYHLDVLSL
ncbi:hypothetical protein OUZ56_012470 [Daphnia magna]|uniref:Uncharacterized protein n=1 Tax=Daphnia magna TaxID=35525 RepID=A0ABQ9Z3C0_9CRUS|nr:hypothetical protein OUZ56_012470 [Daphnia magna]